jgi:hypothetical protein
MTDHLTALLPLAWLLWMGLVGCAKSFDRLGGF